MADAERFEPGHPGPELEELHGGLQDSDPCILEVSVVRDVLQEVELEGRLQRRRWAGTSTWTVWGPWREKAKT